MAKKIEPEVEDLRDELEQLKKKVKNVESDIYSPDAQKSFGEYSGSREEFKREKKLRQIASGKTQLPHRHYGLLLQQFSVAEI